MEDLDNILTESLDNYFELLKNTGYCNIEDVKCIMTLAQLWFISNRMPEYITPEDHEVLARVLYCISDSCLIDRLPVKRECVTIKGIIDEVEDIIIKLNLRITQSGRLRLSKGDNPRFRTPNDRDIIYPKLRFSLGGRLRISNNNLFRIKI